GRQQVDLVFAADELQLGRHVAGAAVADGLLQLGEAATVDEGARVGQVRCAHARAALAVRAVAGEAGAGEDLLAGGDVGGLAFRQFAPGQFGQYVGGDVVHAFLADHRGLRRHHAGAAVGDGLLDRVRVAAPAPFLVGQVGETVGALGVGAVAHRAV